MTAEKDTIKQKAVSESHNKKKVAEAQAPWRSSYLFASCVIHNNQPASAKPRSTALSFSESNDESDDLSITYYNVVGHALGWCRRGNFVNSKTTKTQQSITTFFLESTTIQDFLVINIVAKMKPAFVDELLSDATRTGMNRSISAFNNKLNELVSDLLPPLTGERIDKFGKYQAVRHVLYFEPDAQLLSPDDRINYEESLPLLKRLSAQFGLSDSIEIPTILEDVLLYHGLGYGNSRRSCVAVRLGPLDTDHFKHDSPGLFQIPLIPISFLNHVAICTIKDFCSHTLSSLSLSTEQYWELGKSWRNFVNYRTQYLETRLEVEGMVLKMEEFDTYLNDLLPTIHLYEDRYIEFMDKINLELTCEDMKRSLSTTIKVERRNNDEQLRQNLMKIKTRMCTLDSYLHDSGVADSISTNLKLAKSVEKLTWVVIFIALLSFVATLIPDAIKTTVLSKMLKDTRIEWLLKGEEINP